MKRHLLGYLLLLMAGGILAQDWVLQGKKVPSDRHFLDDFGTSVAIDGDYAIIGDPKHGFDADYENAIQNTGAAYIFEKDNNGDWVEVQKLVSPDRVTNQYFGRYIDISGNYAVVGVNAETKDENGANSLASAGAVYIYERQTNGQWVFAQKIVASDRALGDNFGGSVAIDGDNLVIGALGIEPSTLASKQESGGFYYFKMNASNIWVEQEVVFANIPFGGDQLGARIAIDGNYTVVSSLQADGVVQNVGVAYVFELNEGTWEEVSYITTTLEEDENDFFGQTIAISGNYALIGSTNLGSSAGGNGFKDDVGVIYLYERDGNGDWIRMQEITAETPTTGGSFGASASIDGSTIVIGATNEDGGYNGMAHVYEIENGVAIKKQTINSEATGDILGQAVGVSGDNILITAPFQDTDENGENNTSNVGAAYFYTRESCTPASIPSINASNTTICKGNAVTLSITAGDLNDASQWNWYTTGCGVSEAGTGTSLQVTPTVTTTYFARGENGCDPGICANVKITVSDLPNEPTIVQNGNELSVKETYESYQWTKCSKSSLTPISKATSDTYTIREAGAYNVIVGNKAGCETNAKECTQVLITSIDGIVAESIDAYPNPTTSGSITIDLGTTYDNVTYKLYNATGAMITNATIGTASSFAVELNEYTGIFILKVYITEGQIAVLKLEYN